MRKRRLDDRPGGREAAPLRDARVVATVVAALVSTALPLFLIGALSPWIGEDLGLDPAQVGLVMGAFFLVSGLLAVPGGVVVDRIGATTALRIGTLTAAVAAAAIAGVADRLAWLLGLVVLAACAVPLVDTGNARALAAALPRERQGMAYGVKEASVPAAALLAGIAIPTVAVQAGWRPPFAAAAVLAALVGLLLVPGGLDTARRPQPPPAARPARRGDTVPRAQPPPSAGPGGRDVPGSTVALRLLAIATAGAGAAATAAPAFLIPAVVAHGMAEAAAGLLLAAGSAAGITTRVLVGGLVDRTRLGELRLAAALMACGAVGLLALGTGPTWTTGPGTMLALGAGWGWTGLTFLGAVRLAPGRPAAAAGRVLAGLMAGGAVGTAAFGWLAAGPGYLRAWQVAAATMAVAALLTWRAARGSPRR